MLNLDRLHEAARDEGGVSRRLFLAYAAALSAVPLSGGRAEGRTARRASFASDPFAVGVASGDPTPRGVVLWTRLAPEPLEPGGGMAPENVEVLWELAADDAMKQVVRRGTAIATPQLGHSVHVEVDGLDPDRPYWYRFRAGDAESPVGRTRTMPAPGAQPDELRFAFASCQHFETGLYTAYEHMAKDDLDLVIHLGDYIYEGPGRDGQVRKHVGAEIRSLEDYRIRHAQYKTDPHLRAMHALCPWVVTWDDHEFDNNCAGAVSEEKEVDPVAFLERRANAYQAYYEMMPLRRRSLPRGPHMQLYRTVSFGRLAAFQVLDTRQYRSDQPNDDRRSPLNEAALDPKQSMLGARQAGWLKASLLESPATWNVLAQQVMMGMVGFRPEEGELQYSMDQWPGYAHERIELMRFLQRAPGPESGRAHRRHPLELGQRPPGRRPGARNSRRRDRVRRHLDLQRGEREGRGAGPAAEAGRQPGRPLLQRPARVRALQGHPRPLEERLSGRRGSDIPRAPAVTKASFVVEAGTPGAKPA